MADDSRNNDRKKNDADNCPQSPPDHHAMLRRDAEQAAELARLITQRCEAPIPAYPANNKLGACKHSSFVAISTAPSINMTPAGAGQVPIPYPTLIDLSNSVNTARTVRFNGAPVYRLDFTSQPNGTGDERGTGKGIRSGTVTGEVKPTTGCRSIKIEGKHPVREGDKCTMNGGNNPGIYTIRSEPKTAPDSESALMADLKAAKDEPFGGFVGAIKGFLNTVPEFIEVGLKSSAGTQAMELERSRYFLESIGQHDAATSAAELASSSEKVANTVETPKLVLHTSAERGGNVISIALQAIFSGTGIFRAGKRALLKRTPLQSKVSQQPSKGSTNGLRIGQGSASATSKEATDTLANLRPGDAVVRQKPVRTLVQDEHGRFWLQTPAGKRITPSGSYDFVTMPDGSVRIARSNANPDFSTHLGLSNGQNVRYAGSIRFGNNMGPNRGKITGWTNDSGHYRPPADLSRNAGLPLDKFRKHK